MLQKAMATMNLHAPSQLLRRVLCVVGIFSVCAGGGCMVDRDLAAADERAVTEGVGRDAARAAETVRTA